MKIQLGNKIRNLRKQKNISQEVLANYLGVTFQAVSKWENDIAMPDVALIPAIASFFGVSTDELFDYNLFEIEKKVSAIVDEHSKYYDTNREQSEKILREGLKKYPGNDILLNCLIGILPIPQKSEEVISLCKQLVENTGCDDVKYDAYRIMAEAYCSIENYELARMAVEKIPEIYFSKLSVEAMLLKDEGSYEAAKKQKWLSFGDLLDMMQMIIFVLESKGEYAEALKETECALKLIEVMGNDRFNNRFEEFNNEIEKLKNQL